MNLKLDIHKIHNVFDVRLHDCEDGKRRRDERILMFADLYTAGVKVPPITVVEAARFEKYFPQVPADEYIIVDGRTRRDAQEFLNMPLITCAKVEYHTVDELKAAAFGANYGGAEVPTKREIEKIVLELVGARMGTQKIFKLTKIPPAVIQQILSKNHQERLQGGKRPLYRDAIAAYKKAETQNSETIERIAHRFGLDVEDFRRRIVVMEKAEIAIVSSAALKSSITRATRTLIGTFDKISKTATEAFQDEKNFTEEHLRDVLAHLEKQLAAIQKAVTTNKKDALDVLTEKRIGKAS